MENKKRMERYVGTVTVGAKGQIVIPKAVRAMFNIHPGDEILLLADSVRGIAIPGPEEAMAIQNRVFCDSPTMQEEERHEHD